MQLSRTRSLPAGRMLRLACISDTECKHRWAFVKIKKWIRSSELSRLIFPAHRLDLLAVTASSQQPRQQDRRKHQNRCRFWNNNKSCIRKLGYCARGGVTAGLCSPVKISEAIGDELGLRAFPICADEVLGVRFICQPDKVCQINNSIRAKLAWPGIKPSVAR